MAYPNATPVSDLQLRRQKGGSEPAVAYPIIPIYRQTSRKTEVDAILGQHAQGWMARTAYLCDEVMTDDRVAGVVETRVGGLTSADVEFCPAADRRKERKISELVGGVDDSRGLWPQMVPQAALFDVLKWGLLIGIGYGQIIWDRRSTKEWKARLCPWHPQFLRWDWQARRFLVQTANYGDMVLPDPEEDLEREPFDPSKPTWFVWTPRGLQLGWLNGMIRSLAHLYLMRQWDYRDWARSNERNGMGIIKAEVPRWAKPEDQQRFFEQLSNIGSEAAVAVPVGAANEGSFDLKIVEAMSRNWETFKEFKATIDVDIAVRILGQNLTTQVDGGSRAAEQGHELIRLDKALEDAAIGNAFSMQLLRPWAEANFGDPNLAPTARYRVEPPTDLKKIGDSYKALGDGLAAMVLAEPRVDVVEILTTEGVPLISEEEFAAQEAIAAEDAQAQADQQAADGVLGAGGDGAPPQDQTGGAAPGAQQKLSAAGAAEVRKRYCFAGLPVAIEYPAGTIRTFKQPDGSDGYRKMLCDYGYIEGYLSTDGEPLDCYVGPYEAASHVFVVHQLRAPEFRAHDEDKVMLGFPNGDMAQELYLAHRGEPRAFGSMSVIPIDRFKAKLDRRSPESTTKIRAYASPDAAARAQLMGATVAALLRLAQRVAPSGSAKRKVAGPRGKARYQDRLRENAQRLAAQALAVDVAAIKEEIDLASDFNDLRRRIVERFRAMDPERLAIIVKKANILGHLSGRLDAINEV